ncbi:MAG: OsmC family protein, partial [Gammaproteobacteria bacterium]|nr:OsmC family protein [Gammaproteobacteria bacterium]
MTTSQIEYQGSLRARATHLQSGNSIRTDAPVDNQGKGEDFSPTDLLATSLGACMITIMGIEANKMGINIDNTRISVTKHMSSDLPRRVSG